MEEKNEQGPSGITIVSQASVPGLSDLQNYILFLQTRITRMEHIQIELSARIDRTKSECVQTMEKYFQAVEERGVK